MTEPADQTETLAGAGGGPAPPRSSGPVVLGGRYALTERIASGGMASVWRARDEVLTRTVAVKVLHDHLAADDAFRERFRREAIAAAKLTHPNVVGLYDTGSDGDKVYLVMEFVEGATLKDVIAERSTLASGQAASIGEKVARALDYAHERGLVHRDVKPANILIGDDGAVKVADFGIAKAEEAEADLTKTGMVLGTAAYVAPEQITGATQIDGRADQYALGCMLYEALTGRQPFKGDSAVATAAQRLETTPLPLRSVKPDVPRGLDAVVMRSLSRKPEQRYDTTGQLANALAAFSDADTAQTAALASSAEGATNAWSRPVTESGTASWGLRPPPRAGRHAAAATSQVSRRHGENRWVWAVIALILAGGALAGYGLATGGMGIPTGQQDQAGDGSGQGGQGQVAEA
ncbi:MAG: protein kinase domain-containing protein, partial [Egibacteraceae bacterium]